MKNINVVTITHARFAKKKKRNTILGLLVIKYPGGSSLSFCIGIWSENFAQAMHRILRWCEAALEYVPRPSSLRGRCTDYFFGRLLLSRRGGVQT